MSRNLFEVTYSLGQRYNDSPNGAWMGSTTTNWLTTKVEAMYSHQAHDMVLRQNGGPDRCVIHRVFPVTNF